MESHQKLVAFHTLSTIELQGDCHLHSYSNLKEMERLFIQFHPLYFYGGGSKMLFPENKNIHLIKDERNLFYEKNDYLVLSSGIPLTILTNYLISHHLKGAYLLGIPGSLGGAIRGNAGTKEGSISELVYFVITYDGNRFIYYEKKDLHFLYRKSILKYRHEWILTVGIKKIIEDDGNIIQKVRKNRSHQPKEKSLGSTCINSLDIPSGKLLEMLDLSHLTYGSVEVSSTHCNFLIKKEGKIHSYQVRYFIELLNELFYNYFGVLPEIEIQEAGQLQ